MSRQRDDQLGTIDTINVTPLVDLTFLLLIVFMITAPVLEYTVDVKPPAFRGEQVEQTDHLIVTVDAAGQLYLDDEAISEDSLRRQLTDTAGRAPYSQVFIRADESRAYGEVVGVLRLVKNAGLLNVSLVTTSEDADRER